MNLHNSCVRQSILRGMILGLGMIAIFGATALQADDLIPENSAITRLAANGQINPVNAMDSTVGMYPSSWKMSKVHLQTATSPTPKLGTAVVKMTGKASSGGAKGDVLVAGKQPSEPTHLGMWVYVDDKANVASIGFQFYDSEGEGLMVKKELDGFTGGWKFIEAELQGSDVKQAWKQKDKNGKCDYPIKSINVIWFTQAEGESTLIVDALMSLNKLDPAAKMSTSASMPSSFEPTDPVSSLLIVTNPQSKSADVKVDWAIQRNSQFLEPILPDTEHGTDIAKGCPSWTERDGKRIGENTLTDDERYSHVETDFDKKAQVIEADQVIDLKKPSTITHVRLTNSDARFIYRIDLAGSMDGKTWTDVTSVDMYRKWGDQDIAIPAPTTLRYLRLHHHKNGEEVNKIALPVNVMVYDGTANESWELPKVGDTMASGSMSQAVPAHAFGMIKCEAGKALKTGAYTLFARLKLGDNVIMNQQQFFIMPQPLSDEQLETRLGINTNSLGNLALNRRMGVKWVRFENLKWRQMSKAPRHVTFTGQEPWNVNVDEYFSAAKSLGMNGMGFLFASPRYASSCPPELNFKHDAAYPPKNPEDYYFYVNQVVARFGTVTHSPSDLVSEDKRSALDLVQAFEIWNEPNLNDPGWGHWVGTMDQYFAFMRPAIEAGHRADPNALMMNGGFAGIDLGLINSLQTYTYPDGTHPSDHIDALSVHTYTGPIAPELAKVDTNLQRTANAVSGTTHLERLMRLDDWRNTYMKGKPIWMTETGYDTGGPRSVSHRVHPAYTVRNVLMMLGAGVDKVMIFRDAGDGNSLYAASGMLTSQNQPRAAFFSLATLIRQMTGSGPVVKIPHENPDVWQYAWIRDGKPTLVAWSVTESGTLGMELGRATMTDTFGYDQTVNQTRDLQLGAMPIYLSDVQNPQVLHKAIEAGKQWKEQWTKQRHALADIRTYLFDMGDNLYVDSYDLGQARSYTPVSFDTLYSEKTGYGFTQPGVKNGDLHWIVGKASRDGVMVERDAPQFKFKAQPGTYKLELRFSPRGSQSQPVVIEGLKGNPVELSVSRQEPDVVAESVTVGNSPITIKLPDWGMFSYVRLIEIK